MLENPRRGRQARNFTTNVPKILDLKSSSEQIFFRKLSLGAPARCSLQSKTENPRICKAFAMEDVPVLLNPAHITFMFLQMPKRQIVRSAMQNAKKLSAGMV